MCAVLPSSSTNGLSSRTATASPDGPAIWICGDCHVGNLGPVADAKGKVAILIRDLDQTVVGNPAHDLIRLGLSLATAARGSDLPGVTTAHIIEHLMDGYEAALGPDEEKEWVDAPEPVIAVLKKAFQRRWKHLAEERIEDVKPDIPLGRRFWPLSDEERGGHRRAVRRRRRAEPRHAPAVAPRTRPRSRCSMPPIGSRAAARWAACAMPCCCDSRVPATAPTCA